jgi:hypothetical protein
MPVLPLFCVFGPYFLFSSVVFSVAGVAFCFICFLFGACGHHYHMEIRLGGGIGYEKRNEM